MRCAPREVVRAVEAGEVGGRKVGDVVGLRICLGGGREGAANDLLDAAAVQVDAGSEARHLEGGFFGLVVRKEKSSCWSRGTAGTDRLGSSNFKTCRGTNAAVPPVFNNSEKRNILHRTPYTLEGV